MAPQLSLTCPNLLKTPARIETELTSTRIKIKGSFSSFSLDRTPSYSSPTASTCLHSEPLPRANWLPPLETASPRLVMNESSISCNVVRPPPCLGRTLRLTTPSARSVSVPLPIVRIVEARHVLLTSSLPSRSPASVVFLSFETYVPTNQRFKKFVPVEAYPLVAFVVLMSSFGLTYGVRAFTAVPGEASSSVGPVLEGPR